MAGVRLHAHAKRMKEQLTTAQGIQDMAPFMVALTDEGVTMFGHCGPRMEEALGAGARIDQILRASVDTLRATNNNVPLKRLMLVVEGYSRSASLDDKTSEEVDAIIRATMHGDLAKDYADNPDTTVREVLMTNIWDYVDGRIVFQLWCSPFHYTEGGVIVWDEDIGPLGDTDEKTGVESPIASAGMEVMR